MFNLDREKMLQVSARAYCTDRNAKKVLDAYLLEDFCDALIEELSEEVNNV